MNKKVNFLLKKLWERIIGVDLTQSTIKMLAKLGNINLLMLAYDQIGILKHENSYISGEKFVIEKVLRQKIGKFDLIVFDVGANIGSYSKELKAIIPGATIFAFEPNPQTFGILQENLADTNISCFCLGLGDKDEKKEIYTYSDSLESEHASIYKGVLSDLHKSSKISAFDIKIMTLDRFCLEHRVVRIDFLKIDTEGNEFNVLKGAKQMLDKCRITIIQFEFNEMNVISRVFLKDFFDLLTDYDIYRLNTNRLIELPVYDSRDEIFKFQNLLAISKNLGKENNPASFTHPL